MAAKTNLLPSPPLPLSPSSFPAAPPVQTGARQKLKNITFDTIKFNIENEQKFNRAILTPEIEALKGQRVRIRGYILPQFEQSGITTFVLMRDNFRNDFGPGPIYDFILVRMAPGKSVDYSVAPVTFDGLFDIEPQKDDRGDVNLLYHLKEAVKCEPHS